jgi:hypothetical protein
LIFGDWRQFSFAKGHMAVLLALIFGLKAWGYKLAAYDMLFSSSGIIYGASLYGYFCPPALIPGLDAGISRIGGSHPGQYFCQKV